MTPGQISLSEELASLSFSSRTTSVLSRSGLRTLGHLQGYDAKRLLLLPGFGKGLLADVRRVMASYQLYLRDENLEVAECAEQRAWQALLNAEATYSAAREVLRRIRRGEV